MPTVSGMSPEQLAKLSPEYLAENESRRLLNVSIAFLVIETIFFVMFVASRFILRNYNGIEVWCFMPLAYVCCVANSVLGILMIKIGGAGRHIAYYILKNPGVITVGLKLTTAQEFFYGASLTFSKLAVISLYRFIIRDKWTRRFVWATGAFILLHGVSMLIVIAAMCQPFAYKWDKTIVNGHCGNQMAGYRLVSIPNIIVDLAIIVLPLQTLYKLNTSKATKVGIIVTFLTGGFGIVTATFRCVHFFTANLFSDLTFVGVDTETWAIVECGAYFLCACFPGLRPSIQWTIDSKFCSWLFSRFKRCFKSCGGSALTRPEQVQLPETLPSYEDALPLQKPTFIGSDRSETSWLNISRFERIPDS